MLVQVGNLLPRPPGGRDWLPVGQGESGDHVYRRSDGAAFAKVSTGAGVAALDGERRRTEWLAGQGLGAAEVLDWIRAEDHACLVTRALEGVPASALSAADLLAAWPSILEMLSDLHALPREACPFERRLASMFARAEDVVARNAVNPDFLDEEQRQQPPSLLLKVLRDELPQRLAQEPADLVVCHGDACLPNLIVDPGRLRCKGLIDLGRLGLADRYVDLSLLLGNAREIWASASQAEAARCGAFTALGLSEPDEGRMSFYLRLDPLTWG